jgi:cytoplasmic iron level regulating protein YaaA (DUF328/UPF0246 family)
MTKWNSTYIWSGIGRILKALSQKRTLVMKDRLLIISCSSRKRKFESPRPAWHVYDGAVFRTLKRIEFENMWPKDLKVLILSAKFGLITPSFLIPYYDQRMDNCQTEKLRKNVVCSLNKYLQEIQLNELVMNLGISYIKVFSDVIWPSNLNVGLIPGRLGEKLRLTKRWVLNPLDVNSQLEWSYQRESRDV